MFLRSVPVNPYSCQCAYWPLFVKYLAQGTALYSHARKGRSRDLWFYAWPVSVLIWPRVLYIHRPLYHAIHLLSPIMGRIFICLAVCARPLRPFPPHSKKSINGPTFPEKSLGPVSLGYLSTGDQGTRFWQGPMIPHQGRTSGTWAKGPH